LQRSQPGAQTTKALQTLEQIIPTMRPAIEQTPNSLGFSADC
jgi:hypothetical protein